MSDRPDAYRSVTAEPHPLSLIGPLHADLLAAFNLAAWLAGHTDQIVAFSRSPKGTGAPMVEVAAWAIRQEDPYHEAFHRVFNPLALASDPDRSFGFASAHEAAVTLSGRVLFAAWSAADPVGFERATATETVTETAFPTADQVKSRTRAVRDAVAKILWPGIDPMLAALKREAIRAAAARPEPPAGQSGRINISERMPASAANWGRIRLEPEGRIVRLDGEVIGERVHPKWFALLDLLLTRGGKVVIRQLGRTDELRSANWSRVRKQVKKSHPLVARLIGGESGEGVWLSLPPRP